MNSSLPRLGVIGAGSMGAGIAELALTHGFAVVLIDASGTALAGARERIEASLQASTERGNITVEDAETAWRRLETNETLEALAGCETVIEAIAENVTAKREVFARLAEICPAPTLLATNTSSLRVSAVAAGLPGRERIVGLHFFNPATRMRLVEVIGGMESDVRSVARAVALAERLGKKVIQARDGIGFLVNRSARPYVGEALRLVQEGVASFEQVDRICRMAGGFRVGPFELADLIGVDVNLKITESFWFQSYGEPRWRPSPIQAQLVAAGRLGRKVGAGFYSYFEDGKPYREPDPEPPVSGGGDGRVVVINGNSDLARFVRQAASEASFDVRGPDDLPWLTIEMESTLDPPRAVPMTKAILCAGMALRERGAAEGACGFHLLGPADESRLVEVTSVDSTSVASRERTVEFFNSLGFHVEEVGDAPGMVLGRIVAQLVNEAAFCLEEGVADAADIDAGARLGLNYPRGPIEWSQAAGLDHIRAVLRGLERWRGEERYRLSPLLRTAATLAT
ncbi:MAG: 3-hydroxybutyryl-CoA dehydrogenase [Actinobacteria bacterium]|nr:3-hydroxybutyryl-CoA dehydrogenase [Actinomycetota bacterium]